MRLQNGARAHQSGRGIVAALHLGVEAQRLFEVSVPLGNQAEIVKGIVDEFPRREQVAEMSGGRVEIAVLILDQS